MFDVIKFKGIIDSFNARLSQVPGEISGKRLSEDQWTLKEIIGHLIDSASNNHQRFVRLQFDDLLDFPAYNGEQWIKIQKYADIDWKALIALWYSYNCVLVEVIRHMDSSRLENVWVKGEDALTLSFLVNDYYRHMEWHINHFEGRLEELGK